MQTLKGTPFRKPEYRLPYRLCFFIRGFNFWIRGIKALSVLSCLLLLPLQPVKSRTLRTWKATVWKERDPAPEDRGKKGLSCGAYRAPCSILSPLPYFMSVLGLRYIYLVSLADLGFLQPLYSSCPK